MTATPNTPAACRDCGGPLVRAFDTSDAYDRCRRCGHVFPAAWTYAAENLPAARAAGVDV